MDYVILVDEDDHEIGTMEKMEAHQKGRLHRAFSVLLYNSKGELLLQKRSRDKYHSGGLWTNTCCSHPLPGERLEDGARRKLKQEMGIDAESKFAFKFLYRAELDNGLIENEFDHVFVGQYDGNPVMNPEEVDDWRFMSMDLLREDVRLQPRDYTPWLKLIIGHPKLNRAG